jgi:hypothetical protein
MTKQSGICGACGALVDDLRRGRCFWCYQAWLKGKPVGVGAQCAACGDRRLDDLRHMDLGKSWVVLCHNCCSRAERLRPRPRTHEALCQRLARDRRWNDRRQDAEEVVSDRRNRRDRRRVRDEADAFARLCEKLPPTGIDDIGPLPPTSDPAETSVALVHALHDPPDVLDASDLVVELDEDDPFEGPATAIHELVSEALLAPRP